MKLSEIIAKYEPLGWNFRYVISIEGFWTFCSPRMRLDRGFSEHVFEQPLPELVEIDEEKMLEDEANIYVRQVYYDKLTKQFDAVKADIIRQMAICDRKNVPIPNEMNISFDLKFKNKSTHENI